MITAFEESTKNYAAATADFGANLYKTSPNGNFTEKQINSIVTGIDNLAKDSGMTSKFYETFGSRLS